MGLPDFSEYLSQEGKLGLEESDWGEQKLYMSYAAHIALLRSKYPIKSILELGCGTGWVPTQIPWDVRYVGVDKNLEVLVLAREKNAPSRMFIPADLRTFKLNFQPDLVCSFAVLKHFALEEFEAIFSHMLSMAPVGVFSMHIANENRDDGIDYHHIWVTKEWLQQIIEKNGFSLLYKTTMWQGKTWEQRTGEEVIFAVRRNEVK